MAAFDLWSALLGALVGLAAVLLMVLNGRIAGISGIVAWLLPRGTADRGWRLAFLAGLVGAPLLFAATGHVPAEPAMPASWLLITVAGLLVGFGTRLGGGCTSRRESCCSS
jgi:hypothetical protein